MTLHNFPRAVSVTEDMHLRLLVHPGHQEFAYPRCSPPSVKFVASPVGLPGFSPPGWKQCNMCKIAHALLGAKRSQVYIIQ
jgi:hypothetical protein